VSHGGLNREGGRFRRTTRPAMIANPQEMDHR
jgi:hypothetical protein